MPYLTIAIPWFSTPLMSGAWQDIDVPEEALAFLAPGAGAVPAEKLKPITTKLPKLVRGAGWVGAAVLLYELYRYLEPDLAVGGPWTPPGGTVCCARPGSVGAAYSKQIIQAGSCAFNCNHVGELQFFPLIVRDPLATTVFYGQVKPSDNRGFIMKTVVFPAGRAPWPQAGRLFLGHGTTLRELADPAGNPNIARALPPGVQRVAQPELAPSDPPWLDPWLDPGTQPLKDDFGEAIKGPAVRFHVRTGTSVRPGLRPGTGRPVQKPSPGAGPAPAPSPAPNPSPGQPGTGGGSGSVTRTWPKNPRKRPDKRTKERKVKSRGLKFFDIISEAGDAIDCFYKSLPKNVRKKWDAKQTRASKHFENAGQYGIGGADYKTPALWNNWEKVDLQKAIQCLVTNEIEDRIIGKIAGQSRATAFGVSEAFRSVKRSDALGDYRDD